VREAAAHPQDLVGGGVGSTREGAKPTGSPLVIEVEDIEDWKPKDGRR